MTDELTAGKTTTDAAEQAPTLCLDLGRGMDAEGFETCAMCERSIVNELYARLIVDGRWCGVVCCACVAAGPVGAAAVLQERATQLNAQADIVAALTPAAWVTVADMEWNDLRIRAERSIYEAADRMKWLTEALTHSDMEGLRELLNVKRKGPRLDFPLAQDDIPF